MAVSSLPPFGVWKKHSSRLDPGLRLASGLISLGFGLFLTYQIGFVDDLFALEHVATSLSDQRAWRSDVGSTKPTLVITRVSGPTVPARRYPCMYSTCAMFAMFTTFLRLGASRRGA